MNNTLTQKSLQKMLKQSVAASKTVQKNKEIIETLVSINEIKRGSAKRFSSAKNLFTKLGI